MLSSRVSKSFVIKILIGFIIILCALLININRNISNARKHGHDEQLKIDSNYRFYSNHSYQEQTSLFKIYPKKKYKIVMFGCSYTEHAHWNELLNRCDVANRGIGSDITEGYKQRIEDVYSCEPSICFVEGGINDLSHKISIDTIVHNLSQVADSLRIHNIKTLVTSCFFVDSSYTNAKLLNQQIDSLNARMKELTLNKNIELIDLNPVLNESGFRKTKYSSSDGIHLNGQAYLIWKEAIEKELLQNGL